MPKYSIIVPVYNAETYLKKCLDSILKQKFTDFEVIVINDGSTDGSYKIVDSYDDKRVKQYAKENGGVSDARNMGISKVKGKYFMFVDADDYINENALGIIDMSIKEDIDILSFNIKTVDYKGKTLINIYKPSFHEINGEEAIKKMIEEAVLFDTPVAYVYRTEYFKDNDFKYAVGRNHEDFGLTPLVIAKANKVRAIDDYLYYYLQSENSITRNDSNEASVKRAYDMLYHYDNLLKIVSKTKMKRKTKDLFNSFIANAVINKASTLSGKHRSDYIKQLRIRNVTQYVLADTVKRLFKKYIMKISINLYLKLK